MSHDIRTPMNAIMGMTTLAKANSGDPVRVLDCLQKISAASGHLLNLINDVLDMNKIERAQITLNREKIYLPDLIKQIGEIISAPGGTGGPSLGDSSGRDTKSLLLWRHPPHQPDPY